MERGGAGEAVSEAHFICLLVIFIAAPLAVVIALWGSMLP